MLLATLVGANIAAAYDSVNNIACSLCSRPFLALGVFRTLSFALSRVFDLMISSTSTFVVLSSYYDIVKVVSLLSTEAVIVSLYMSALTVSGETFAFRDSTTANCDSFAGTDGDIEQIYFITAPVYGKENYDGFSPTFRWYAISSGRVPLLQFI